MRPLSLLQIANVSGLGGTGATAFRLARLLSARGHRVLFCVPPAGIWGDAAAAAGVDYTTDIALRRGFRPATFFRDVRAIKRLVRDRQADIVHVHRSADYWRAALALGGAPRSTRLVRSRGVVMPLKPHIANRWLHNSRTDMVICTAQLIYDQYRSMPGFDSSRVRLLHDGVDLQTFRPGLDGAEIRAELNISPEAPVVAVVARLAAIKGHIHLVEAAPQIVSRYPGVRFLLTGRTVREDLTGRLRERAAALGVAENFVFAGSLPEVPRVLAASDVFALCSVGSEGSSRGTLEAMACGLPVVASSVGCLPDLLVEGQTGFLVPHSTPDALASRLCRLLGDADMRRRMGTAARRRVEENFDEEDVVDRLELLYAGLLEGESR